ncbi:DUF3298 and DUF4163 domain-containing protein [Anaeromicropila populeti]|uniref:DUF3298 domain-containing protein n=1 Tax=Anaeromicropila populeti TaxID=37658 RepID=A0A1I6I5H4_9FIRM|nr:DUF3298 and DUF4163 domain-containing protein [Anaeromicropila populeti]SFR61884.1 protein of unknown function [Anaeromicropila populeti]
MNKLEEAKKVYETITPPMSYSLMVERSVNGKVTEQKKAGHYRWCKPAMASVAAVFVMCIIMLNTIPAFASAAYEIPVIGDIAQVFTLREYQLSNSAYDIQVEVPSIRNTGNTDLEKRVNNQIQDKIDQIVESAKQRGMQAIDDQLAEGGKEEDLIPFHIMITFEVKSSNENTLSFVINDTESSITSYTYQTFYNIDLNTHKDITLSNNLGEDYSKIIVDSIQKQIAQRIQEHPDWSYTVTETDLKEMVNDMKFYINDVGNVVISFDKGEIAPPPMGIQDFEIIK